MNKTLVLAAVLFALIGVYWVVNQSEPVAKTNTSLVDADSGSVTALKIMTATDTTELRKEGDGWKLIGAKVFPANAQSVGRALQKFSEMSKKAMVTDKPDRYAEFEVDGSKGVLVNFNAHGKDQSIYLGKAGPTMQTCYARLEGSKEVWEIGGNHASAFRRPPADWRDKTITSLPMDSVKTLTIVRDGTTIELSKQDTVWSGTENGVAFSPSKPQVERVTRLLSRMSTVEFADTLSEAMFAEPKALVRVSMLDGSRTELKFVPRDDKQYFVRKTGALSDYVIYNSTADVLLRKKDDLIEKVKPAG